MSQPKTLYDGTQIDQVFIQNLDLAKENITFTNYVKIPAKMTDRLHIIGVAETDIVLYWWNVRLIFNNNNIDYTFQVYRAMYDSTNIPKNKIFIDFKIPAKMTDRLHIIGVAETDINLDGWYIRLIFNNNNIDYTYQVYRAMYTQQLYIPKNKIFIDFNIPAKCLWYDPNYLNADKLKLLIYRNTVNSSGLVSFYLCWI